MRETAPQLVVIAGSNGAGKTTLAPFLLRDKLGVLEYVNADPIALGYLVSIPLAWHCKQAA